MIIRDAVFVLTTYTKDDAGDVTKFMVLHTQKLAWCKFYPIRPQNAKELKPGNVKKSLDENGS